MKIYTGFGDKGQTALYGGKVVDKNHLRVDVYGTIDELNSVIGVLRFQAKDKAVEKILDRTQNELFVLSAEIATPDEKKRSQFKEKIELKHVQKIEKDIDLFAENLPELKKFILPGGGEAAATGHLARTVCRRAERLMVTLQQADELRNDLLVYINRLSDLFFVLSRFFNMREGIEDIPWNGL